MKNLSFTILYLFLMKQYFSSTFALKALNTRREISYISSTCTILRKRIRSKDETQEAVEVTSKTQILMHEERRKTDCLGNKFIIQVMRFTLNKAVK